VNTPEASGWSAFAITHLAAARRHYAGGSPRGISAADDSLTAPFERVALRIYAPTTSAPPRTSPASPTAVIVYFPDSDEFAALRGRAGEWLCGSLVRRLGSVEVVRAEIGEGTADQREAAYQVVVWAAGRHPTAQLAVLGAGTGGALAARAAMIARDRRTPHLERQALISPDFNLLIGPPATASAFVASIVARLSELPATLLQRREQSAAQLGGENLAVLLREAGVAVREIEYPETSVSWAAYPKAARYSGRALDDLVAFFHRGLIDDGFDVVPAWNVH
jgi:acetyl esterase/lipase